MPRGRPGGYRAEVTSADLDLDSDGHWRRPRPGRAGMRAVVLTTTLPAEAFAEFDNVIAIVNDFTQLDVEALLSLS